MSSNIISPDDKDWVQIEPLKSLMISSEDVMNIKLFFSSFSIKMPLDLKIAVEKFEELYLSSSYDDQKIIEAQNEIRVALAACIASPDSHDIFKDQIFLDTVDTCKKIVFIDKFYKQVEEEVGN